MVHDELADLQLLMVEDDPSTAMVMSTMLELQVGLKPMVVGDADTAWEVLGRQPVDVVLSDMRLPGSMDGEDLCRQMKADEELRLVPVILMTGANDDTILAAALAAGADDFLPKPVRKEHLLARLRGARRLRRLLLDLAAKNRELTVSIGQLQQSQEELLHARKMEAVGQLASGIAHELNTPIQFIGDNLRFLDDSFADLQMLLRAEAGVGMALSAGEDPTLVLQQVEAARTECDLDFLNDEVPAAIRQALDGVERVRQIVVAMRDFAHPGTGDHEAVDLNAAVESTAVVARNAYKYVADLVLELDGDLPSVLGDAGGVKQVILNLIVNAAHAIEDRQSSGNDARGTITVRTRADESRVVLEVADDGCGMDETTVKRMFDPFFTTKAPGRGTGQGLAIIHNVVVHQHKGAVDVESALGRGTSMRIHWPLVPAV